MSESIFSYEPVHPDAIANEGSELPTGLKHTSSSFRGIGPSLIASDTTYWYFRLTSVAPNISTLLDDHDEDYLCRSKTQDYYSVSWLGTVIAAC